MSEPVAQSAPKAKKPPAIPFTTGKSFTLGIPAHKGMMAHVLLSKVWTCPDVGVFIDIPITGTPRARSALGDYVQYAVEKTAARLYATNQFGVFNPKMGKAGLHEIQAFADCAGDGAPTSVRITFHVKPHRAGGVLGAFVHKLCFAPPASDRSTVFLSSFPDTTSMEWAAKNFIDILLNRSHVCFIGGKKASVKPTIIEKFEAKFKRKADGKSKLEVPKFKPSVALSQSYTLPPDCKAFGYSFDNPIATAIAAHTLSSFGHVGISGKQVSACIHISDESRVRRISKANIGNQHKNAVAITLYEKLTAKDAIGENSIQNAIAIGAIASGLPIMFSLSILKSAKPDAVKLGEAIAKVVQAAK